MDGRASSAHDARAASPPLTTAASSGRKPKAKAPLPPTDTRNVDVSSAEDSVESASFIMEQKENMVDRDIELSVVLPGDIIKSTTVHGSKPMMDLLIFLCAQYHLNPSSYTIDLLSAEKNPIKFKPNTPIGMLEAEKVVLKPKVLDKKKPTPIIPEKTVRVVINFKKSQKAIVRVNPHASLQELTPIICSKCDFDPSHTLLLKDYQSQEPLDLTKSLNDLGLRELYAMDISRAASATAFNKSSLQESCQIPQNLDFMKEKENKGFFSFFQRSKKKREQTASAPATPLINKHRPTFARSNTISKPYISNTLPSEAPKKRRAPLPPMPASQSEPHDLARIQERSASHMVKSASVDENDKSPGGADIMRTGSLSSTSTGNSSLKRMKRKAPSPPSKIPSHQSVENSPVTVPQSEDGVPADSGSEASSPEALSSPGTSLGPASPHQEQCTTPTLLEEPTLSEGPGTPEAAVPSVASLTSGISSDYSLEEIDEKEELREVPKDEAENVSLKSPHSYVVSTDVINALKNDADSTPGSEREESSQNDKEEKQKTRTTDGQESHTIVHDTSNGGIAMDTVTNLKSLGPNKENVVPNGVAVFTTNIEDNIKNRENSVGSVAKNKDVDMEVNRQPDHPGFKSHSALSSKENDLAASPGQKPSQPTAEKTTMQDAAIQTAPSCSNFTENHQDQNLSTFKVDEIVQTSNSRSTQHLALSPHDSVDISNEFRNQDTLAKRSEGEHAMKVPVSAHNNEDHLLLTNENVKNSPASSLKNHPLYRQDYNPKPKPSNEITREYIPKIGMTTYKIVPPKSLEISKDWESETIGHKDDQKLPKLEERHVNENVKETAIQTEGLVISEGVKEPPPDLKPKPSLRAEHQVPRAVNSPVGTTANPPKPPRMTRDSGLAPFAPNLEDIHNILETKFKPRISNPQAKPSSFFLQMQKRASGQYVTSAAAKSVPATPSSPPPLTHTPTPTLTPSHTPTLTHTPSPTLTPTPTPTLTPTPKELANKEAERDALPPPEQTRSPLSKTTLSAPQPQLKSPDGDISQKPAETSLPPAPPPVAPKPVSLPTSQVAALNLKTLKTFGAPRPFSSSAPSPFALAVVKRSQSFSRERAESCSDHVSAPPPADSREGAFCSANTVEDTPQLDAVDKENKSAHNEQNSKEPTAADSPSFTLKRQSSLTLQSSDPEQIRQSLLTAIRTGEAAARLKRVTVPSNTISVNGRSGLGQPMPPDAQHSC